MNTKSGYASVVNSFYKTRLHGVTVVLDHSIKGEEDYIEAPKLLSIINLFI